ncbi:MAG TPA: thioredoxin domain-containing protein [Aggregatilineaceae bacterium]|nr:thioredoxin domain-containing protein [Aggregatilineaceae bacterium]
MAELPPSDPRPVSLRQDMPGQPQPYPPQPTSASPTVVLIMTAAIFLLLGLLVATLLTTGGDDDNSAGLSERDVQTLVYREVGTQIAALPVVGAASDGEENLSQADLQEMVNQAVTTQVAMLVPTTTPIPPTPTAMPVAMTADDDAFQGPADAPVTIIEFSDFQCGYCGRFYFNTLQPLLEKYPDQVKFVYRDFVIFGEDSERAAVATECAEEQGKFWEMHNSIFESRSLDEPPALSEETLVSLAGDLDLDTDAFQQCLTSGKYTDEIAKDFNDAVAYGFQGTPGFVINGVVYPFGAQPIEVFDQIIQAELEKVAS